MTVGSEWWPIFRSEELVELLRFLVLLTAFQRVAHRGIWHVVRTHC